MKPILCNYYITYRCNARCQFCDIWQNPNYFAVPDSRLDDVESNLIQLKKIGIKFIDFTGGEPLLHRQLPQMLSLAKYYGFYTSVTTNCTRYPKMAEDLRGKIDLLHFSLDSMNEQEHNELRGISNFQAVMESLTIARLLNEKPDILFTATSSNFQAINLLSNFAASQKLMLIVNPVFEYSNQSRLTIDMLRYLERFQLKPYVYINRAFFLLLKNRGNDHKRPRCRAVSAAIVISPKNEILLPCFHHAKFALPIQADLTGILNSARYQQIKKKQGKFSFCKGCTINCYFDPSFLYKLDRYFFLSLASKAKYGFDKYLRSRCGG